MMMNILEVLDRLDSWRRTWQAAKEAAQRKVLRLAVDSCNALVEIEDVKSDAGILLQERVRTLYSSASELFRGTLQAEELEIVINALASARIYYWVRFLNGHASDEIEQLIRRRAHIYGRLPSSLSIVDLAIRAVCDQFSDGHQDVTEDVLLTLRQGCLADFARLEALSVKYDL